MTKMRDITIIRNPAFSTIQRSATLCERVNQLKSEYFKLDLIIGKIVLSKHPMFNEEDIKAVELRNLLKEYKQKTDMSILPHLREQLFQIDREINQFEMMPDKPVKELELMKKEKDILNALLEKETTDLRDLMLRTYTCWDAIKKIRDTQKFSSTTARLNARQYKR